MTTRRNFLTGLIAAPAVITTPGLLMPVKAWVNTTMLEWWAKYEPLLHLTVGSDAVDQMVKGTHHLYEIERDPFARIRPYQHQGIIPERPTEIIPDGILAYLNKTEEEDT